MGAKVYLVTVSHWAGAVERLAAYSTHERAHEQATASVNVLARDLEGDTGITIEPASPARPWQSVLAELRLQRICNIEITELEIDAPG